MRKLFTTQALCALLAGDELCPHCNGRGRTNTGPCRTCKRTGTLDTTTYTRNTYRFRIGSHAAKGGRA